MFFGTSFVCAAMAEGGAFAFNGVTAVITSGSTTGVSCSFSIANYSTLQKDWIYGKADLTIVILPAQQYLPYPQPNGSVSM